MARKPEWALTRAQRETMLREGPVGHWQMHDGMEVFWATSIEFHPDGTGSASHDGISRNKFDIAFEWRIEAPGTIMVRASDETAWTGIEFGFDVDETLKVATEVMRQKERKGFWFLPRPLYRIDGGTTASGPGKRRLALVRT